MHARMRGVIHTKNSPIFGLRTTSIAPHETVFFTNRNMRSCVCFSFGRLRFKGDVLQRAENTQSAMLYFPRTAR